jgi:hypothetical protein
MFFKVFKETEAAEDLNFLSLCYAPLPVLRTFTVPVDTSYRKKAENNAKSR